MLSHVGLAWYPGAHKGAPAGDAPVKFWKDMMGFDYAPPWETPIHPSPWGLTRPRPPGGPLQTPQRQQCQAWWGVGVSGLRRAARSSGLHAGCDANGTLGKGRPGSEWLPRDGGVHRDTRPPECTRPGHVAENSSFRARALGRPAACCVSGFPGCGHVSHCDAPTPGAHWGEAACAELRRALASLAGAALSRWGRAGRVKVYFHLAK